MMMKKLSEALPPITEKTLIPFSAVLLSRDADDLTNTVMQLSRASRHIVSCFKKFIFNLTAFKFS